MATYRLYIDESGTHSDEWLVIGVLFVPNHGVLHAELCRAKDELKYFAQDQKRKARYQETHLVRFRRNRDVELTRRWMQAFLASNAYFRCIAVDWSLWDGRYFGEPFEADALKKRRAYKKWTEMLLHPEFKNPTGPVIRNARVFLDRLRAVSKYDVLDELEYRFTRNYDGSDPYIAEWQHTESWRDANQCLQLCDLLTGSVAQSLISTKPTKPAKIQARQEVEDALAKVGVRSLEASYWRGFAATTLNERFPKFSVWCWRPDPLLNRDRKRRGQRGRRRKK